ncbi:MAG: methylated-DNA--[protein]-cysteine S-methyltransferase [Halopseudomonas sp.]
MKPIKTQRYHSPYGEILLGSYDNKLCVCDWLDRRTRLSIDARIQKFFGSTYREQPCPVIDLAIVQLDEYFSRARSQFDIALALAGTEFQQRVWRALLNIPFGSTLSYLQLAQILGSPSAVRAVANANGANALSLFVPCHRIIGSDGSLTGYAGGVDTKQRLLALESAQQYLQLD